MVPSSFRIFRGAARLVRPTRVAPGVVGANAPTAFLLVLILVLVGRRAWDSVRFGDRTFRGRNFLAGLATA